MRINEERGNVFDLENSHYLVHCVSMDFKLGAGIALEFEKRYSLREQLQQSKIRPAILTGRVFNLITKDKYWQKPGYDNMLVSLTYLRAICIEQNITKLAMPKIGCGLDKLEWEKVKRMIAERFKDTDIEIEVRYL